MSEQTSSRAQQPDRPTVTQLVSGYRFTPLVALHPLQAFLHSHACRLNLLGTVVVAPEGINLSLCGDPGALHEFLGLLPVVTGMEPFQVSRAALAQDMPVPFRRLKVRVRSRLLPLSVDMERAASVRHGVQPQDWHRLLNDPQIPIIDLRNHYEVELGSFVGSINPRLRQFGDFPDWLGGQQQLWQTDALAMFCTGGIRCEKAAAWMHAQRRYPKVLQLDGGILNYLQRVAAPERRFVGACFVFDDRVTAPAD